MTSSNDFACPVCGCRVSGSVQCRRCGADLSPILKIAHQAWLLRQQAREMISAGRPLNAEKLARRANRLRHCPEASDLIKLAKLLQL